MLFLKKNQYAPVRVKYEWQTWARVRIFQRLAPKTYGEKSSDNFGETEMQA